MQHVGKLAVPCLQLAIGPEQACAFGQGVERRLQRKVAHRQLARALPGILGLDAGDVGIDADRPALGSAQLVDLEPAPVCQQLHMRACIAVAGEALLLPAFGRNQRSQRAAMACEQIDQLGKMRALVDDLSEFRPDLEKGVVAHHQPVFGIEQGKAVTQRFDRVAQAAAGRVGILVGGFDLGVDRGELDHRLLKLARAAAHHGFERDGVLEHGKGPAVKVAGPFDPVHQRGVDRLELADLLLEPRDFVGFERGRHQRPITRQLKV